jgi:hypothetical protein
MASLRFISLFIEKFMENSFNLKSREAGSLSPAAYLPARKYTAEIFCKQWTFVRVLWHFSLPAIGPRPEAVAGNIRYAAERLKNPLRHISFSPCP